MVLAIHPVFLLLGIPSIHPTTNFHVRISMGPNKYKHLVIPVLGVQDKIATLMCGAAYLIAATDISNNAVIVFTKINPLYLQGNSHRKFCSRTFKVYLESVTMETISILGTDVTIKLVASLAC
tara:strand:+ start:5082 stop:5450 length:369 start_codon:yes stop_codon:yes gene_type:complete